jgi:hypothetical protein
MVKEPLNFMLYFVVKPLSALPVFLPASVEITMLGNGHEDWGYLNMHWLGIKSGHESRIE